MGETPEAVEFAEAAIDEFLQRKSGIMSLIPQYLTIIRLIRSEKAVRAFSKKYGESGYKSSTFAGERKI